MPSIKSNPLKLYQKQSAGTLKAFGEKPIWNLKN